MIGIIKIVNSFWKKSNSSKLIFFISCYTKSWFVHSQSQLLHSYLQLNKWLLKNRYFLFKTNNYKKKIKFPRKSFIKIEQQKWYTTWHLIKCKKIMQDIIKNRQSSFRFKSVTVLGENKIYSKTHIRIGIGFQWWYAYNDDSIIQTQRQCQHCTTNIAKYPYTMLNTYFVNDSDTKCNKFQTIFLICLK